MEENLCQMFIQEGINIQNEELKKLNNKETLIQSVNRQMDQTGTFQMNESKWPIDNEKIFNISAISEMQIKIFDGKMETC
jgi:hypothetical protein